MIRACIIFTIALGLAICISVLLNNAETVEIQAAGGSFNVTPPIITPTPSPSPTPAPTTTGTPATTPMPTSTSTSAPTATPSVSPSPTGGSGQSGSSQPSISLKLYIDMIGQETEWLRTSEGKVLEDIVAISSDERLTLRISRDTFALDASGEPLTTINITAVDPLLKAPPLIPPTDHYLIYIYEFSPDGASFSKPVQIEVNYNPSDLPKSPNELKLEMYALNGVTNEWEMLPGLSDIETNTIICSTNHLSIYAVIAAPLDIPAPNPQPTPAPTYPATHSKWILLILVLPAASLVFFIYVLLRWRRRNSTDK